MMIMMMMIIMMTIMMTVRGDVLPMNNKLDRCQEEHSAMQWTDQGLILPCDTQNAYFASPMFLQNLNPVDRFGVLCHGAVSRDTILFKYKVNQITWIT